MANVFVSYRTPDVTTAMKLAEALRAAGHEVWLDRWEITIGDSIVERINQGLTGLSYLVLCWSASGESTWQRREWQPTLARQLEGEPVKILPVRLSGGTGPAIIRDLRYADLEHDWDAGVRELLAAIR
ncbi:toll/interleukin-1 receptor domain-containing protein [Paractinoplanes durhamensis]|uniref:TIR domain-containing protein n=1 Tax=Paractinoplanes durhamensis TaxID=113563 RepID=A0ABQ3Z3M5_9ACTN|nr:toll/interleukin-1 receptor domain-containing protein [Actinoplanes durhamensis]GIE04419.1 hypothetical protein Adu01nite_57690 [Actinoplanes durhamensis]